MKGLLPRPVHGGGRLAVDLACGAAAGAVAVWTMNRASELFERVSGKPSEPPNPETEGATEKTARLLLKPFGVQLEGERKRKAGTAVHWAYGILCGALYGATRTRVPHSSALFGLAFGLGLFVVGDELAVPVLGLAPPPNKVPGQVHLKGFLQHLVYGAVTEGSARLLGGSPS